MLSHHILELLAVPPLLLLLLLLLPCPRGTAINDKIGTWTCWDDDDDAAFGVTVVDGDVDWDDFWDSILLDVVVELLFCSELAFDWVWCCVFRELFAVEVRTTGVDVFVRVVEVEIEVDEIEVAEITLWLVRAGSVAVAKFKQKLIKLKNAKKMITECQKYPKNV